MAAGALFLGHGRVHIVVEDTIFVRTVGVVAGGTVTVGYLVVHVLPNKESTIGLVALRAQRRHFISQ